MATATLARVSAADAVVNHLTDRIRRGELAPGSQLPGERDLRAVLGVSRLTLREGLARLSALGLVRVVHGKGAFVSEGPRLDAFRDALVPLLPRDDAVRWRKLVEARALIESELAARAARLRSAADLDRLRAILDDIPDDILSDPRAAAERDLDFHREVARIADNPFLGVMWEALASPISDFLVGASDGRGEREAALRRHRPLLEALVAGDAETARRAAQTHVKPCLAHYERALKARLSRSTRRSNAGS